MTTLEGYLVERLRSKTALTRLMAQSNSVRVRRGTLYTPQEILQQPWTWVETSQRIRHHAEHLTRFLGRAGVVGTPLTKRARVILVGAGTSDYVGKSVLYAVRKRLQTDVAAIPSTDLL